VHFLTQFNPSLHCANFTYAVNRFDRSLNQETCNSTGTMMLHENDYFKITAQAEPVPIDSVSIVLRVKSVSCVIEEEEHVRCELRVKSVSCVLKNGSV